MKKFFLLPALIILLSFTLLHESFKAQTIPIEFTRIIINGKIFLKPLPDKIIFGEGSKIKLYYDYVLGSSAENHSFKIFINNDLIYDNYNEQFVDLNNLSDSASFVTVSLFAGKKELGSITKQFINAGFIKNTENKIDIQDIAEIPQTAKTEKPVPDTNSNFLLFLLVAVILLQIGIIIYLITRKKDKRSNKTDEVKIDEETYQLMRKGFAALEKQNRELKSKIKKLAKIKIQLEEANLNLLDKKEKLEETKNQLEIMSEKKDELIATALHDIKNPASAVHGFIELLQSYDLNAHEQQEVLESLIASSSRVLELAQEVSETFAKQEYDNKINPVPAMINDSINNVIKLNFARATKKKITIAKELVNPIPKFKFDPSKIEEVIDNLVNNAIKYSTAGTEVTISAKHEGDNVLVSVHDTGVGIPKEELPKIFDKGVKLSPRPTGGESSSGLGMWIVKRIIESHGGRVWAQSKVGEGSTFGFELPITEKN